MNRIPHSPPPRALPRHRNSSGCLSFINFETLQDAKRNRSKQIRCLAGHALEYACSREALRGSLTRNELRFLRLLIVCRSSPEIAARSILRKAYLRYCLRKLERCPCRCNVLGWCCYCSHPMFATPQGVIAVRSGTMVFQA